MWGVLWQCVQGALQAAQACTADAAVTDIERQHRQFGLKVAVSLQAVYIPTASLALAGHAILALHACYRICCKWCHSQQVARDRVTPMFMFLLTISRMLQKSSLVHTACLPAYAHTASWDRLPRTANRFQTGFLVPSSPEILAASIHAGLFASWTVAGTADTRSMSNMRTVA